MKKWENEGSDTEKQKQSTMTMTVDGVGALLSIGFAWGRKRNPYFGSTRFGMK